jgi:hypothetical protein
MTEIVVNELGVSLENIGLITGPNLAAEMILRQQQEQLLLLSTHRFQHSSFSYSQLRISVSTHLTTLWVVNSLERQRALLLWQLEWR